MSEWFMKVWMPKLMYHVIDLCDLANDDSKTDTIVTPNSKESTGYNWNHNAVIIRTGTANR
jgi:hypothetical protein